jgi:hypothetical protein
MTGGGATSNDAMLWHVTVTVAGEPHDLHQTHASLLRLLRERPFIHSLRYAQDRAEVSYWEESTDMVDAASLALRLWNEHQATANLPDWKVVGLEVLAQETYRLREMPVPQSISAVIPRLF